LNAIIVAMRTLDDGRHRAEFYRMWRAGYSAGFTHPKSLEVMGPRGSKITETIRNWILDGTKKGRGLAELVRTGAAPFEDFERALLTSGEESGRLDDALRLLGDFYTAKHKLMLWVKKKMAYPFFTLLAACFIAPFPLFWFGHTALYVLSAFGGVALLLLYSASIVAAVAASHGRQPPMARARLAGLTLPRALRLAADASANPQIRNYIMGRREADLAARPVGETMSACPHMTPDFIAILKTAERTGDWTPVNRIAELYEDGFR
jgi:type II secretory pathway component PulF